MWSEGLSPPFWQESPQERIERLVAANQIQQVDVERALALWRQRWQSPLLLPNGDAVVVRLNDLYHALVAPRVLHHPERIESAIQGVFELRTTQPLSRRIALSQWDEDGTMLYATIVLEADGGLRTIHIVDLRKIRKEQRKGHLLWKR